METASKNPPGQPVKGRPGNHVLGLAIACDPPGSATATELLRQLIACKMGVAGMPVETAWGNFGPFYVVWVGSINEACADRDQALRELFKVGTEISGWATVGFFDGERWTTALPKAGMPFERFVSSESIMASVHESFLHRLRLEETFAEANGERPGLMMGEPALTRMPEAPK